MNGEDLIPIGRRVRHRFFKDLKGIVVGHRQGALPYEVKWVDEILVRKVYRAGNNNVIFMPAMHPTSIEGDE